MSNKYITAEGKTHLLKLGFAINGDNTRFEYLALGGEDSVAAANENKGDFKEVQGSNYHRVQLHMENEPTDDEQKIVLSGTFDDENFTPSNDSSDSGTISEIAIVNSYQNSNNEKYFAFAQVPEIVKNDNITLKYTIVIEIL